MLTTPNADAKNPILYQQYFTTAKWFPKYTNISFKMYKYSVPNMSLQYSPYNAQLY